MMTLFWAIAQRLTHYYCTIRPSLQRDKSISSAVLTGDKSCGERSPVYSTFLETPKNHPLGWFFGVCPKYF